MAKYFLLVLLQLVLLFQPAIAANNPAHVEKGFMFYPPEGWVVNESSKQGHLIFFDNPQADNFNGLSRKASIMVAVAPLGNLSEAQFISKELDSFSTLYNFQLLENKTITVNNKKAYVIGGTFESRDGAIVRIRQMKIINQNNAYTIQSFSLAEAWSKYEDLFTATLSTFQINAALDLNPQNNPALSKTPFIKPSISIRPPVDWAYNYDAEHYPFLLFTPEKSNPNYAEISVMSFSTGLDLPQYMSQLNEALSYSFRNFKVVSSTNVSIEDIPGVLEEVSSDDSHQYILTSIKYWQAYTVTAYVSTTGWENLKDKLKTSALSFKYTN